MGATGFCITVILVCFVLVDCSGDQCFQRGFRAYVSSQSSIREEDPTILGQCHSRVLYKHLHIRNEIVQNMQNKQHSYFSDLFKGYSKVALIGISQYENKGDPAIAMGTLILLKKLRLDLIYFAVTHKTLESVDNAKHVINRFPTKDVLVLFTGGGNIFAYEVLDRIRQKYFLTFPNHTMIMLPQSVWFSLSEEKVKVYAKMYNNKSNLTMIFRDPLSLKRAKNAMPNITAQLVPDMAFQIGPVPRFRPPAYDILYVRRSDKERVVQSDPIFPKNVSFMIDDWLSWSSPRRSYMESVTSITTNGFSFLQRGKVVITDRLHAHIMSVLSGIPHVILDSVGQKITPFYNTWTHSIPFVRKASTMEEAVNHALELLNCYNTQLPDSLMFDSDFD